GRQGPSLAIAADRVRGRAGLGHRRGPGTVPATDEARAPAEAEPRPDRPGRGSPGRGRLVAPVRRGLAARGDDAPRARRRPIRRHTTRPTRSRSNPAGAARPGTARRAGPTGRSTRRKTPTPGST